MNELFSIAKRLHNALAIYNGAGYALGWKTAKIDALLDESKRVIEATPPAQPAVPLTPDELADKCEAWLKYGGAGNIVDAFEAGYRKCEAAHGIKELKCKS